MSAVIAATTYRNWDVTVSSSTVNIFTAKRAGVQTNVTEDWTENASGAVAVSVTQEGTDVQDDITVTMSNTDETVIEYMVFSE